MTKRKAKRVAKMFTVRLTRTLELHATVEVEAFDADQARNVAIVTVDDEAGCWVEGAVVDQIVDSVREGVS